MIDCSPMQDPPTQPAAPTGGSRLGRALPFAASILCGLALALPYTIYDGSLPAWFAAAPVLWLVMHAQNWKRALAYAALFSLAWTLASFSFLRNVAPAGMLMVSIYTSLYYVGALLLMRRLCSRGLVNAVFGAAALWALVEIVRSTVPVFAFPWLLLGHSLVYDERLRQGADVLGVYGLSFVMMLINASLAFGLPALLPPAWHCVRDSQVKSAWKAATMSAILVLGVAIYGAVRAVQIEPRLRSGPPIGVIQGNIVNKLGRSDEQYETQLAGHLKMHRELAAQSPALICWAETMVPGSLNVGGTWGTTFREGVVASGIPTLAGSSYDFPEDNDLPWSDRRTQNCAYLLDAKGQEILRYAKRRCVAFGEYIPFTKHLPFLKILRAVTRDQYTPGTEPSAVVLTGCNVCQAAPETFVAPDAGNLQVAQPQPQVAPAFVPSGPTIGAVPVFGPGGPAPVAPAGPQCYRVAVNICVEDIHPDIAREGAESGATVLINLTNDGWFYGTFGPRSHLQAAAWRAIEVRRPVLRVTNTGRTVAIDPLGRIQMLLPEGSEGTALVRLSYISVPNRPEEMSSPRTFYMWVGEGGVALVFAGLFACTLLFSIRPFSGTSYMPLPGNAQPSGR